MKPNQLCKNIEIKARCPDVDFVRRAAEKSGARKSEVLVQIDTYFPCATGRLKLREINGTRAELIWYQRANDIDARESNYIVVPTPDPAGLLAALSGALGVRGRVHKTRELWLYENVRIHLDEVRDLGTFLEFEAVISASVDEKISRERLAILSRALSIRDEDRIARSYSDLLGF